MKVFTKKRFYWKNGKNCLGNILNLSGIKFKNEIYIYSLLMENTFDFLKYPNFINSDKNEFNIERIDGTFGGWRGTYLQNQLVKGLHEFNGIFREKRQIKLILKFSSILSNPINSIFRGGFKLLIRGDFSLFLNLCLNLITYLVKFHDTNRTYLIHRDLGPQNNMFVARDQIVIFDFESSIITKRFFLIDIVQVSILRQEISTGLQNNFIDWTMIKGYLEILSRENKYNDDLLKLQIWLIIFRRIVHTPKSDSFYLILRKFLIEQPYFYSIKI